MFSLTLGTYITKSYCLLLFYYNIGNKIVTYHSLY